MILLPNLHGCLLHTSVTNYSINQPIDVETWCLVQPPVSSNYTWGQIGSLIACTVLLGTTSTGGTIQYLSIFTGPHLRLASRLHLGHIQGGTIRLSSRAHLGVGHSPCSELQITIPFIRLSSNFCFCIYQHTRRHDSIRSANSTLIYSLRISGQGKLGRRAAYIQLRWRHCLCK